MIDKPKALEVIKHGMTTEIWGQRFYREAIERTADETGKRVFQSLVAEEEKHLAILRGQYAAISGDREWLTVEQAMALAATVDPTTIFPGAEAADQLIPAGTSDEEALKLAMDFEKRGYEFYQREAAAAVSDYARQMWNFLAQAEDKHYAFLQDTYEFLTTNGVWYFDDQERPFFEG